MIRSESLLGSLFEDNPFLLDFLNNLSDSVYIVDESGVFQFINKSVERVEGFAMNDVLGKTVWEVYANFPETPLMQVLHNHEPVKEFAYSYTINGQNVYQSCRAFPIFSFGRFIGAYAVQRDITSFKNILEENFSLHEKIIKLKNQNPPTESLKCFGRLIGRDPLFLESISSAMLAAKGDSSVFLTGSTGSGKEVFARAIHDASARKNKPFLAINCAAIPETLIESILFGTSRGAYTGAMEKKGLFEQAEGGTLFLDEINSMPLMAQAKLLRVLEEKKVRHLGSHSEVDVDVRIISSSNVLGQQAIENHMIREDLFYRLSVINIVIPDLSKRKSDILLLANHFLQEYNLKFNRHIADISEEVKDILMKYSWPGNVRELKHCIEAAMNFVEETDSQIEKKHLAQFCTRIGMGSNLCAEIPTLCTIAPENQQDLDIFKQIESDEKDQILKALMQNKGNVTHAAEQLGMSRQSLNYRMQKYGIKRAKN